MSHSYAFTHGDGDRISVPDSPCSPDDVMTSVGYNPITMLYDDTGNTAAIVRDDLARVEVDGYTQVPFVEPELYWPTG